MNTFLTSDLHLGHRGIINFLRADGVTKERPFISVEEMNETIIDNWNKVVGTKDMVVVLGDAVINRSALPLLGRLQGRKQLVLGNHDLHRTAEYLQYFENVRGSWFMDGFVLSHIPIHVDSLERWRGCIHGHLHSNRVMRDVQIGRLIIPTIDTRYLSVCVEHTDYTPITLDEVNKRFTEQQENV